MKRKEILLETAKHWRWLADHAPAQDSEGRLIVSISTWKSQYAPAAAWTCECKCCQHFYKKACRRCTMKPVWGGNMAVQCMKVRSPYRKIVDIFYNYDAVTSPALIKSLCIQIAEGAEKLAEEIK